MLEYKSPILNKGVRELSLCFHDRNQRIPTSLFLFASASLARLHVTTCTFPDVTAAVPSLANLVITEESLHLLLSQCTSLERPQMQGLYKIRRVHVRCPSLRIMECNLGDVDAPLLEDALANCLYTGFRELIRVAHARKLEFLGYITWSGWRSGTPSFSK